MAPKSDDKKARRRSARSANGRFVASPDGAERQDRRAAHSPGAVLTDGPTLMPPATADLPPLLPELFINRELSWLAFNDRVLFEAEEQTNPLLERVKFAAIFATNLDEFFMIRVAGIERKVTAGVAIPGPDGRTPIEQLRAVRVKTQESLDRHSRLITGQLIPDLSAAGIEIAPYAALSEAQREAVTRRFEREIFPILTPQAIDRGRRFPHVSNRSLNLIAVLELPDGSRYARIKIPATLPRFLAVPNGETVHAGTQVFTWLEQVVAANLTRLFARADVIASYPFHVTRDSDIELDEDEGDDDEVNLMTVMRDSIAQRAFGPVVRLMIDGTMPEEVRDWLVEHLRVSEDDLYVVEGPLATEDLWELVAIDRPDLKEPPYPPAAVPGLSSVPGQEAGDIFAVVRERDILVHHPYQSFAAVVDFLRAAAADPNVVAIKQRINLFKPVIIMWVGGITLLLALFVFYMRYYLTKDGVTTFSNILSNGLIFLIFIVFILGAVWKKVNVFDSFIEGAKQGFETAVRIIPYLVGMLVAISVLRSCGVFDYMIQGLSYLFASLGFNTDFVPALPTALMKPLSGSGARAMMITTMTQYGPDSFQGLLACVFQGSADTTFYIVALYFGSVGIKNTRYAIPASLIADLAGVIAAIAIAYFFFH